MDGMQHKNCRQERSSLGGMPVCSCVGIIDGVSQGAGQVMAYSIVLKRHGRGATRG